MSIEVQCPNPDCAAVHRVKNRWAGRRGTCPDCGTIIKVPVNGMAMKHKAVEAPEPDPLDEEAAAAAALAGADDAMDDWDAPPKKKPVVDDIDEDAEEKPVRAHDHDDEEEEAVPARDDEDEDEEPAPKKKAAALDDDEDEEPVRARDEDEDEEPSPKRKAAALDDDEDEDEDHIPKRGQDEEDEDEEPAPKRKAAALDDDEEANRITKRARDDDEDEDEEPAPKKKAAALDDDEEAEDRITKRPRGDDEEEDEKAITTRARDDEDDEDEPRPRRKAARGRYDDQDEDFDNERKPAGPGRRFGIFLVVVYLLGICGLVGVAVMSFLPGRQIAIIGGENTAAAAFRAKVPDFNEKSGIKPDARALFIGIPAGVAGLALVGFLVSLLQRNFGIVSLLISYPVVIASLGLLMFGGVGMVVQTQDSKDAEAIAKTVGVTIKVSPGVDLLVGVISATAATSCFALAVLLIHRRLWARIVFSILFLLGLGLVGLFLVVGMSEEKNKSPVKASQPSPTVTSTVANS